MVKREESAGSVQALMLRWEAMRERVVAKMRGMGVDEADAEDLFGQALLRGCDSRDSLENLDAAEPWFWQLARRVALDHLRAKGRDARRSADDDLDRIAAPEPVEPPCSCSVRMLDDLPVGYATMLRDVDVDGMAVQDAAERCGISPNNASVRLYRARRALRERLAEVCGTTSVATCQDCGC